MVELFEENVRMEPGSSKGNQLKWFDGTYWYKADYTGYEGLAEHVCSEILKRSTLEPSEYVLYDTEQIRYKSQTMLGCRSANMLPRGWQLITLERLIKQRSGFSIGARIYALPTVEERIQYLVKEAIKATGLADFGIYFSKVLTIDALFLNEDRHTHNIAVLESPDGRFHYCPFFDHGASLLSDTAMDYPTGDDVYRLMGTVRAKTVCGSFDEALEAAEVLYGNRIGFHFSYDTLTDILNAEPYYPEETKQRVRAVLTEQKRRYGYLFKE